MWKFKPMCSSFVPPLRGSQKYVCFFWNVIPKWGGGGYSLGLSGCHNTHVYQTAISVIVYPMGLHILQWNISINAGKERIVAYITWVPEIEQMQKQNAMSFSIILVDIGFPVYYIKVCFFLLWAAQDRIKMEAWWRGLPSAVGWWTSSYRWCDKCLFTTNARDWFIDTLEWTAALLYGSLQGLCNMAGVLKAHALTKNDACEKCRAKQWKPIISIPLPSISITK